MDYRRMSELQDIRKADELQPYILKNIVRTDKRLGSGSFGYVLEVIHAGARCAAKVLHEGLVDSRGAGQKNMIRKIEYECRIMSELRHPNIVQFLGICFFDESTVPVLVMECLEASLEALLTQTSSLSIHAKINVLLDVAKGLVYLHSHSPPIVHRDLTARNVLLTNTMLAKIADLGNSRIIESNALSKTLSTVPGTLVYMPPEAMANPPQYNEKLDIFSFGHLALYTALQDFPCELLLGVYNDPKNPNRACARNEVERRIRYVGNLKAKFGANHTFTKLVNECLHNHPQIRPSAVEVLQQLQKLQKDHGSGSMRFSLSDYLHDLPEERVQYRHHPTVQHSLERIQSGGIDRLEKEIKHRIGKPTWRQYVFHISESALQYFTRMDKGPEDEVKLDKIIDVVYVDDDPGNGYQFSIIINGRKPWKLKASSEKSRHCWIAALKRKRGHRSMLVESARHDAMGRRNMEESLDVDAYAYVEMAPPEPAQDPSQKPRQYQQLGAQNLPQLYEVMQGERLHKQQSQRLKRSMYNMYDSPKNQQLDKRILGDVPQVRETASRYVQEQQAKPAKEQQLNLPSPPQPKERPRSFNVESMEPEQVQLLINQLERMGVLGAGTKEPTHTAEVQELYPEVDEEDTYVAMSDEEERVYDDIPEPTTLLYVNAGEVQEASQAQKKTKPEPPPRIKKGVNELKTAAIPRTKSFGRLLKSDLSEELFDHEGKSDKPQSSWMKADPAPSTVREDDPLLLVGERELYLSKDSLSDFKVIGQGQFGVVFKALLRNDDDRVVEVAIKTIRRYDSQKEMDNFVREMTVMSRLIHPNIIHLYGIVKEEDWIVLEYLPNGDLKTFLTEHHRPVKSLMKYMADVAMGMLYLSERGLIHRDLAARNIMVGNNESCKVADFGLLREVEDYKEVYTSSNISLCPLRWMAPESLEHRRFSVSSDVWSFGILLWEMFNPTEIPYSELTDVQVTAKLARGYTMPIPTQCPSTIAKIMKSCWQANPSKRPSFAFLSVLLARLNLEGAV